MVAHATGKPGPRISLKTFVVLILHMKEKYNINHTTLRILALFSNDYRKKIHLREISRDINIDVKAVGLQVNRLDKANVLSSSRRGRNKEYQLNLSNMATRSYMLLAEVFTTIRYLGDNYLIKKLATEIEDEVEAPIILFGSHARGEATEDSDIDLFIIAEQDIDEEGVIEVGKLIGREVNINSASKHQFLMGLKDNDPLIGEVVSNHIVIKGAEELVEIMWRYHGEHRSLS